MARKNTRKSTRASSQYRVTPEFREEPDIEKLGLALIAIAKQIAEQKKAEEAAQNPAPDTAPQSADVDDPG